LIVLRLETCKQEFGGNAARLDVLSPLSTLLRGYSITTRIADGSVVIDAASLTTGDRLRLNFHRGSADCRVEG
jgi:exodeoxyribonuclease VII large subunit